MSNATDKLMIGKTIKMACMRPGLCKYLKPKEETILVTQETLEQLAKTSYGIPVVVEHQEVGQMSPEELKDKVCGRVADMHFDADESIWYAHFVVDTQEAVEKLNAGWGISTAYFPEEKGPGGTLNAVPYDWEMRKGKYEHLAIVRDPRYEMAKNPIFYNSKKGLQDKKDAGSLKTNESSNSTQGVNKMYKLFKMLTGREEIKLNDNEEAHVEIEGKLVPMSELIKKVSESDAVEAKEKNCKTLKHEDEVEVEGKKMKVGELVEKYQSLMKKNAEKPEDKEKENESEAEKEEEKKAKNSEEKPEEKKEKNEEEKKEKENEDEKKEEGKKNASDKMNNEVEARIRKEAQERFEKLNNAVNSGNPEAIKEEYLTTRERVELGKDLYGSAKK